MPFCSNCGQRLAEGVKFCPECGAAVGGVSSQRKQIFEGEVRKCPNCGGPLKAFEITCPVCGYELRDAKASSSVQKLAETIAQIEQSRPNPKKKTFKEQFFSNGPKEASATDQSIASAIQHFPIPNTKEDIIEFMLLASANIDTEALGSEDKGTSKNVIAEAWIAKYEQAYQKAKILLGTSPEFSEIQSIYDGKKKAIKKGRQKSVRTIIKIFAGIIIFYLILGLFIYLIPEPSLEAQIKERQSHLETVVEQIEADIAAGRFNNARNKTYTLTFDSDLSSEKAEYWEKKQAEILSLIDSIDNGNDLSTPEKETEGIISGFFKGIEEGIKATTGGE